MAACMCAVQVTVEPHARAPPLPAPPVAEALAANSTLTCVNLRSNEFSSRGEAQLAALVRRHASITSTGADGPDITELCTIC